MFDMNLLEYGPTRNLRHICDQQASLEESNRYHWTIVGEWTSRFFMTRLDLMVSDK